MSGIRLIYALATAALLVAAADVRADGFSSAAEARKYCSARGGDMQSCCADAILVSSSIKQARLEKECATGVSLPKTAAETAQDERDAPPPVQACVSKPGKKACRSSAPAPQAALNQAPAPQAAAVAAAAGTPPASPAPASAPTGTNAAPADPVKQAQNNCRNNQARQAAASVGSLARRFGIKVPSTDCP